MGDEGEKEDPGCGTDEKEKDGEKKREKATTSKAGSKSTTSPYFSEEENEAMLRLPRRNFKMSSVSFTSQMCGGCRCCRRCCSFCSF